MMTIGRLKKLISDMDDNLEVRIEVESPKGMVCPDGATVGVGTIYREIDWHYKYAIIVPEYRLKVKDVLKWTNGDLED